MSKTIPLYLDDEIEEILETILNHKETSDDFESESSCLRLCTKRYLKNKYPELLLKSFENE